MQHQTATTITAVPVMATPVTETPASTPAANNTPYDTTALRRQEGERRARLGYEEFPLFGGCMRIPLTTPVLGVFTGIFLLTVFVPVFIMGESKRDFPAFAALMVPLGAFIYILKKKSKMVSVVQCYARFLFAWLVITPMAQFAGLIGAFFWMLASLVFHAMLVGIERGIEGPPATPGPTPVPYMGYSPPSRYDPPPAHHHHQHHSHEGHWHVTVFFIVLVFGVVGSFVAAGCLGKFISLTRFDRFDTLTNPRHYTFYGCSLALGMGAFETFFMILLTRWMFDGEEHQRMKSGSLMILACCDIFLVIPMHLLESYYVGLAIARHYVLNQGTHLTVFRSAVAAALVRTIFVTVYLLVPVFSGHWWLGIPASMLILVGYLYYVVNYERTKMPLEYLRRVGYMYLFGYGALDDGGADDDEDDNNNLPVVFDDAPPAAPQQTTTAGQQQHPNQQQQHHQDDAPPALVPYPPPAQQQAPAQVQQQQQQPEVTQNTATNFFDDPFPTVTTTRTTTTTTTGRHTHERQSSMDPPVDEQHAGVVISLE